MDANTLDRILTTLQNYEIMIKSEIESIRSTDDNLLDDLENELI